MTKLLEVFGYDIDLLNKIGVYTIHHVYDPTKLYVGSTAKTRKKNNRKTHHGFYKRFYDHFRTLSLNIHHSRYLQNVVNKYGIQGIVFQILEICDDLSRDDIFKREQYYIDTLKPVYNSFKSVHPEGRYWTEADKLKARERMKGKSLPKYVYDKIKKPIYQLDINSNLIQKFNSIKAASDLLNIDPASISKCIAGKRKSAGGYRWIETHPDQAKALGFSEERLIS